MRDALAGLPVAPRLLTACLVLLGALVAPHAQVLSPAVLAFFYLALLWRLLGQSRPALLPGRWLMPFLMIAAIAIVVVSTGLYDGRLAGTALLVVMLGLKLLEIRARRDIHITVFLGYFVVMTHFLYGQTLGLALYLLPGVIGLTAVLVGLNRVDTDLRQLPRDGFRLVAAGLPFALMLFLLFPRLHAPLWGINTSQATTGISGEMTLGNIGELSRSNATAFRVRFFGAEPAPEERYWRGPVLWQTDGRNWSPGRRALHPIQPAGPEHATIDYEITLEPTGQYWLFGLDVVTNKPSEVHLNNNHALVDQHRVNQRRTYRAGSNPDLRMTRLTGPERRLALQLPDQVSPRVRALVEGWQRESHRDEPLALVRQALAFFRREPFVYTLSPGVLQGDPIDQFLFETRRGFCEHYAGSFAVLMRLAGIPSRVVIGYQGGEPNPHADHWVIRQSDAHAWVEIWLPQRGWWRVDPTAAVAPERIEQPIDAARSQTSDTVVFGTTDAGWLGSAWRNAVWLADAVDLGWHHWIVGFSADRQTSLLQRLGLGQLQGLGLALALLVGGGLAGGLVLLLGRLPRRRLRDPLPRLWQRFTAKLRRAGLDVPRWQGPDTVCAAAARRFPTAADDLAVINRVYVQLRYGRRQDAKLVPALRQRIRRLRLRDAR